MFVACIRSSVHPPASSDSISPHARPVTGRLIAERTKLKLRHRRPKSYLAIWPAVLYTSPNGISPYRSLVGTGAAAGLAATHAAMLGDAGPSLPFSALVCALKRANG